MHSEDEEIEFKESSGNVFADLGLENAEELFMRANLGISVYQILKEKKLKQRVIAQHLGISQSDVSHLMNGHFDRFSTDKLLDFLKLLDQKVTVQISARQKDEAAQQVILASYSGL
ncbi:MAG: XRE family transcriptional regulator [Chloroflexi bacterium]|nr:MAG: XRE family transcriptional regulator [Chloroflexota bacterium]